MAEELHLIPTTDKEERYKSLLPQLESLIAPESNLIANLANVSAALKQAFDWWWVGFYWVENEELVLGPFQGPIACTRIAMHRGVCGSAWAEKKTLIVPNVHEFPGHIACSAASNSEIVVPILKNNVVLGVLDCDSEHFNHFDIIDQIYLEKLVELIATKA